MQRNEVSKQVNSQPLQTDKIDLSEVLTSCIAFTCSGGGKRLLLLRRL